MLSLENDVKTLYDLLEHEISAFDLLIEELTNEAECLKTGATDSLLKVVNRIEHHVETIRRHERSVQETIGRLLETLEKGGEPKTLSRLVSLLPSGQRTKIHSFQRSLIQLRERARQINEKNKLFIQEHLNFVHQLTSSLINPTPDSPSYPGAGRTSSFVPPYALSREV